MKDLTLQAIKVISEKYDELGLGRREEVLKQKIADDSVLKAVENLLTEEQSKDLEELIKWDKSMLTISNFTLTCKPQGISSTEYAYDYIDHTYNKSSTNADTGHYSGIFAVPLVNGIYLQYDYSSQREYN